MASSDVKHDKVDSVSKNNKDSNEELERFNADKNIDLKKQSELFKEYLRNLRASDRENAKKINTKDKYTPEQIEIIFSKFNKLLDEANNSIKAYDQFLNLFNDLIYLWLEFFIALREAELTAPAIKKMFSTLVSPFKMIGSGAKEGIELIFDLSASALGKAINLDPIKDSLIEKQDNLYFMGKSLIEATKNLFKVYPDPKIKFDLSIDKDGHLTSSVLVNGNWLNALDKQLPREQSLKSIFDSNIIKLLTTLDGNYQYDYETRVLTYNGNVATNKQITRDLNKASAEIKQLEQDIGVQHIQFSPGLR